jgi:hypothetical protein
MCRAQTSILEPITSPVQRIVIVFEKGRTIDGCAPCIGPIRAALLIALMQTPHRFHTKRQLWAYSGLAVKTRDSGEYRVRDGQLERTRKQLQVRGLNNNRNPHLKQLFKSTAISASTQSGPFGEFYGVLLKKGIKTPMARLTLARKIAAIVLAVWKNPAKTRPPGALTRLCGGLFGGKFLVWSSCGTSSPAVYVVV